MAKSMQRIAWALCLVAFIPVIWQLMVWVFKPEMWLFPGPVIVWDRFVLLWTNGVFQSHFNVTLVEIALGYLVGCLCGVLSGYPIAQIRLLEKMLTPYLIAANSIPVVAFAPLLLLWFGSGIETKIAVAAIMVYFPVTISSFTGFQQQPRHHQKLMASLKTTKWQTFRYLDLPFAVPGILSGLKIGAPLAVVGAVVGEFLGSGAGLGHLILEANGTLDTSQLFVAIIALALIGISLYGLVIIIEHLLIGPWHHKRRQT